MSGLSEIETVRAMLRELVGRGETPPTVSQMRQDYDGWGLAYPLPEGATVEAVKLGGVTGETVRADGAEPDGAVLYLHGGGYAIGSAASHRHLCGQLSAASGLPVHVIDYRLAPEHPFPAAVDDALAAYKALLDGGIAPGRIVIAGDSAGGGLTVACALAAKTAGLPQPAGLFCISPWCDLRQAGASYAAMAEADLIVTKAALDTWAGLYLAGASAETPLASPVLGDLAGLAPMLIHVGSDEVLMSDATRLAEAAGLARVPVELVIAPEMPHVWHYMWAMLSAARLAIADAGAWIEAKTAQ